MGIVLAGVNGTMIVLCVTVSYLIDSPMGIPGTFWLYAGFNLLGVFYISIVIKETKGLTRE